MARFTFKNKTTGQLETVRVTGESELAEAKILSIDELTKPVTVPLAAVIREGDDVVYFYPDGSSLRLKRIFIFIAEGKIGQGFLDNLQAATDVEAVDVSQGDSDSSGEDGLGSLDDLDSRDEDDASETDAADPIISPPLAVVPVVPLVVTVPPVVIPPLAVVLQSLPDIVPDPLNPAPETANEEPLFASTILLDFSNPASTSLLLGGQLFDAKLNLNDPALLPIPRDRYYNDRNNFRVGGPPETFLVRNLTSDDDGLRDVDLATDKLPVTVTESILGSATATEPFGSIKIQGIYGELTVLRSSGTFSYKITGTPAPVPAPGDPIPPPVTPADQLLSLKDTFDDLRSGQFLADFFRYQVQDPANISDGSITVRIMGRNDSPTTAADVNTALERATAPTAPVLTPDPTAPAARPTTHETGTTATQGTRLTGVLGNDTDVEPVLQNPLLPSFRYIISVSDYSELVHDTARQVERSIYQSATNPNALRDPAQKWAVSGLFTNLANGTGSTGFGNFLTDPDVTAFEIKGRFGILRFAADGSWRYVPNGGVTIPANAEDAFTVRLFDLASDVNQAKGALAGDGTPVTLGLDYRHAGEFIRITAADVTAALAGEPVGTVSKAIPQGHQPFNVTGLEFPDAPSAALDSSPTTNTGTLTINGRFGTLVVNKFDGTYTYTIDNNNTTVDQLGNDNGTRGTLTEVFRYTMADENPFDTAAAAIQRSSTLTITIQGSNDSPVFTLDAATLSQTTREDETVTLTTAQLNSVDADDTAVGLTYTITTAPLHGTIVHSVTGDLTIGGTFTQADIIANRVSYRPVANYFTGDTSPPGPAIDTVSVSLRDGGEDAAITQNFTVGLTVRPVNDAPTAAAPRADQIFTEVASPDPATGSLFTAGLYTGSSASTGPANEVAQRLTELRFTFAGAQSGGADRLLMDGSEVILTSGTAIAATAGNSYAVNVATTGADLTITLSGILTTTQVATLLNNISFRNISEDPRLPDRTLTLTRITDNGTTPDPGVDFSSPNASTTISVVNVNDAPVFTAGAPVAAAGNFTENGVPAGASLPLDLFNLAGGSTLDLIESVNTVDTVTRLIFDITGVPTGVPATPAQDASFEKLVVGGVDVMLVAGTTLPAGGLIAAVSTTLTGLRVELTGSISAAAATALIEGMGYRNTSEDPVAGARSVTLVSIRDSGGILNGGDNETDFNITKNFNVVAVNDRPIATANTPGVTFTEGDIGTLAVFTGANTNPIEQLQTFNQLVFRISGALDGANESLTLNGTAFNLTATAATAVAGGETVTIVADTPDTFTLTVSGSLTILEANAFIESVRYRNNLANPTDGNRIVSLVSLTDSGPDAPLNISLPPGPLFSTIVNVDPVNDAPLIGPITNVAPSVYVENAAAGADLFNGADIDAADPGQSISTIVFTVTGVVDGAAERLFFGATPVPLQTGTVNLPGSPTASVVLSGTTATVTVSGGMTPNVASNLINNVTYQHTSNDLTGNRVVTLVSIQDNGGGSDNLLVNLATTVTLTPVNDAPITGAIVAAAGAAATYLENAAAGADVFNAAAINTIETGQNIDQMVLTVSNVFDGATERLVINGTDVLLANGSTNVGALTVNVGVVAGLATLTITGAQDGTAASGLLNTLTYRHTSNIIPSGTRGITLVSLRDDGGTASGGANTVAPGLTANITVTAVNDIPAVGPITAAPAAVATYVENSLTGADLFNGAAPDTSDPSQSFDQIILTVSGVINGAAERLNINGTDVFLANGSTPVGALTANVAVLAGVATVTISGTMTPVDAGTLLNNLTYFHNSETLASGTRNVTLVSLRDNGGTANGGVNLVSPGLVTNVTLTAVNDAPALASGAAAPTFNATTATAVVLAPALTLSDLELSATGSYAGSRLVVARTGAADVNDLFSFAVIPGVTQTVVTPTTGTLSSGGNVIAGYSTAGGILDILFANSGTIPTQTMVENVARGVQYSSNDPAEITARSMDFTFSDGNSAALEQGTGGNLATTVTVNINVITPVAMDLDGNGIAFVQANHANALAFDLDGDHINDQSAWVGSGDGVLVYDANHDGKVTDRSEFVFTDSGKGRTDLASLAISYDTNHDLVLDRLDTGWADFRVWHDINGDLQFATDELSTLDSLGIVSLSLTGHGLPTSDGNVLVHQTGTMQLANGATAGLADAAFAFIHGLPPVDEVLLTTPEIPLPPAPPPPTAAPELLAAAAPPAQAAAVATPPEAPVPPPPPHEEVQPHAVA